MKKIKLIIFDVDNTLVYGEDSLRYYQQYSPLLERTLSEHLNISIAEAKVIADGHRREFNGRGEKSFETHGGDLSKWYDAICTLDPDYSLKAVEGSQEILNILKNKGYELGAITDGPTKQSLRILRAAQVDPSIFTFFIGWERGGSMPKGGKSDIFKKVARDHQLNEEEILMVGDSLETDIVPASQCGVNTIYISDQRHDQYITIKSIKNLLDYL